MQNQARSRVAGSVETLEPLHDVRVHVTTEIDVRASAEMLGALPAERSAHSWREVLPSTALGARDVDRLIEHEQRLRPTSFYWFWCTERGRTELFAVATIADRISTSFPVDGFPVIARSYIRPSYRGRGLYAHLLAHRVRHCRLRFGAGLRGIHFGTNEPSILHAARSFMPTAPICLGEELLALPEGPRRVGAYLGVTERYRDKLRAELVELDAHPTAGGFARGAHRLLAGESSPGGADLSAALRALDATGTAIHAPGWRELLAFCDAIPVEPSC